MLVAARTRDDVFSIVGGNADYVPFGVTADPVARTCIGDIFLRAVPPILMRRPFSLCVDLRPWARDASP